jgi:glutathione S-transferase
MGDEPAASGRRIDGLVLYLDQRCLFCTRVLHAMRRYGIDFERRDLRRHPEYREELIRGGGTSQVPCLRIDAPAGVEWLYESGDIVRYLARFREVPPESG